MSLSHPSKRAALRTLVVVTLSLIVLVAGGLDFRRIWVPIGDFGYRLDGDDVVTYVADGSPAARAGMLVGDIVDLPSTPPQFRYYAVESGTLEAGQSITFGLKHDGHSRLVTLAAAPQATETYYAAYRVAVLGIAILYVALGAALVLLRPSVMTWGFFLYCLANAPFTFYTIGLFFPYPWPYIAYPIQWALNSAGIVGLLVFALCFLNDPLKGWRSSMLRATPWLFAALVAYGTYYTYLWGWVGGPPGELFARVYVAIPALLLLAVMYLFIATYVYSRGQDRQRIRWVVVAFGVNLAIQFAYNYLDIYWTREPLWVAHVMQLSTVIVPVVFVYAVIRHRIIDVSFVVSRTLVFGILTTILVGAFSIIDWFFTDYLRLARLGTIAEVAAVVAFGLWFNGLHRRVDSFIDATFFRQRHKAEAQLARGAAALPLAPTTSAVAHFLVSEPVQAMILASAALFRRNRDGIFVRELSEGWSSDDISRLGAEDDPLLMLAQTERGPLSLYDLRWRTEAVPAGPARPVLALPIMVRRELAAIVFYGSHLHGEALDPDEIKALAGLQTGAAAAYDHLDAENLLRENESMKRQVASLEMRLAQGNIQPA
jgi:hypothetical protein